MREFSFFDTFTRHWNLNPHSHSEWKLVRMETEKSRLQLRIYRLKCLLISYLILIELLFCPLLFLGDWKETKSVPWLTVCINFHCEMTAWREDDRCAIITSVIRLQSQRCPDTRNKTYKLRDKQEDKQNSLW